MSDPYLFRFAAGHWNVRYAGGALFAMPDAPGLVYLRELLRRPGAAWAVPATELAGALHCHRAVRRCRPGVEPGAEGIGRGGVSDAGPVLDRESLDACRREYERIDRELGRAGRDNDPARLVRLRAERRELADFVDRARRPGGPSVDLGDERRKAADRVTKAIRRPVDKIRGMTPGSQLIWTWRSPPGRSAPTPPRSRRPGAPDRLAGILDAGGRIRTPPVGRIRYGVEHATRPGSLTSTCGPTPPPRRRPDPHAIPCRAGPWGFFFVPAASSRGPR